MIYGHMTNANRLLMKSLQWKISWSSHEETFVNGKMTFKIIFILFNATRLFSYILKISVKFCFLCFQGVQKEISDIKRVKEHHFLVAFSVETAKNVALENFTKCTNKHTCWRFFSIKLQTYSLQLNSKKPKKPKLNSKKNFAKFLEQSIFKKTSERLLLSINKNNCCII